MTSFPTNNILLGDCVSHMASLPSQCADFVLTDPPYLVNYRNRSGQSVANDVDDRWLAPA
jgi:adenine-specific DNA-methyltransferase